MLRISALAFIVFIAFSSFAQKRPVSQSDYETWKVLVSPIISNNGQWVAYEVNPQQGDGWLYIYNTIDGNYDSISRGFDAKFSGDSKILVFKIKPQADTVRKAKLAEVKKDNLPKDSLGIYTPEKKHLQKVARVKSFKLAENGADWLAYHLEKAVPEKDTTKKSDTIELKKEEIKNKKKDKKKEPKGTELVIMKVIEGKTFSFKNVSDYEVAKNGELFAFIASANDSIDSTFVHRFEPKNETSSLIFENPGESKQISIDEAGTQLAFVYSSDTSKYKNYDLMFWDRKADQSKIIIDSITSGLPGSWRVSEHKKPVFSKDGLKLYFGTAPKIETEPKDTLLKEEKVQVDVWNWKDPLIQPQQKKQLEKEQKRSYMAVYFPDKNKMVQLGSEEIPEIRTYDHANTNMVLGYTDKPWQQLSSWDDTYRDYFAINISSGEMTKLLSKQQSAADLSPGGKFILWYLASDSSWYVKNVLTDEKISLSKNLPFIFYNELNDIPQLPGNYGIAGWTENDEYVLIYDKYDIWKFDPTGKEKPYRITAAHGRENNIQFRYQKLDKESTYIENKMLLTAFNFSNKQSGYFVTTTKSSEKPKKLIMDDYHFLSLKKAKDADKIIWRKEAFDQYPDLFWSNQQFDVSTQISNLDKQRNPFLWGDVQLVSWTSSDGDDLDGLLYTPENLNPDKKYPMLVYFYERNSDDLHRFRHLSPSRSIINPAYCVSNGYVVFVPDIPYLTGYPGESALRAVVSGTLAMPDQFPFIDKDKMGIQGQSWGGYQVAYLVTQTNLYAAAMAGAPVSNMTSAYGGIRWGSGMSRMFQYEKTQSRIGGTLWEKPLLYIENSPVFYADKIETPLLIMHNDNDGAVPWYQGIELFIAMRRLQKPAWMLTYNDEEHNLTKWPNRMDLDIRMYQFFDHYLKDAPEPIWMKDGVPAIDKGKKTGYESE
ncbi:MAG: prolyl oligopeptidase family serine peptidase [Bacteroidales bacterium]|nr:prolyl oligopeptidase family serine peptidase [Bacteroidales bacterium]